MGQSGDLVSILPSIGLIDLDFDTMFFEALQICSISKGGVTMDSLFQLEIDKFDRAYKLAKVYIDRLKGELENGSE